MDAANEASRIHILGIGNIGLLYAHALARQNNPPPITLLLHRASLLDEWNKAEQKVTITTKGIPNSIGDFDVELVDAERSIDAIQNLIIATKAVHTVHALTSIKRRLNSASTILFTQNGLGTIEEVDRAVFPDPTARPSYLTAIASHGVYKESAFRAVHAGLADVTVGPSTANIHPEQSEYLLSRVIQAPVLNARAVDREELMLLQLEKLAVNASVNPLTAIHGCRNGELLAKIYQEDIDAVLAEFLEVFRSVIERTNAAPDRFSHRRLKGLVVNVMEKTAGNYSSMLQDVRAGRATEIDYINGYISKKGSELGIPTPQNDALIGKVKLEHAD